ncbi:MAG: D-glycero-beta-D-manno-heptose 1-phosphate adenylyltransferase [Verrucomicrobiota bacterium]|jgi:D-glycero-beta-D-manno-heptose 1-phosphate adenylyltransferase|nr:D-glycero-beta-D-manno-heptose 1-phosphate adenylyltransferase [Verrucomicrobiota bacterium]
MELEDKMVPFDQLEAWRSGVKARGRRLVVTNGCFDILHIGHVRYLSKARAEGDLLLVGLNGDDSVRQLKGPERPVNGQGDRALLLAALSSVDSVCVFQEKRATRFLSEVQPDIYVKGGDYTLDTLDTDERQAVTSHGGRIVFIPFVDGRSTSSLIETIRRL